MKNSQQQLRWCRVLTATLIMATVSAILAFAVVSLSQHQHSDGTYVRSRRDLSDDNTFVYENRLHRPLWTKLASKKEETSYLGEDVFVSVKTSAKFHRSRLGVVLKTWQRLADKQTWFFTDAEDAEVSAVLPPGHLVNTKCSSSHNRSALNCKMAAEIAEFLRQTDKRWFCHFDDDNYVNVPALGRLLRKYDPAKEWYLGKTSVRDPLEVMDRSQPQSSKKKRVTFWFATGGAGLCLSRPLAARLAPLDLVNSGESIRLPDDVTLGYLVEHKLGTQLTRVRQFHSHLEPLRLIPKSELAQQISFSYSYNPNQEDNYVDVEGMDVKEDPTRFMSIHCFLFPQFCPQKK